GYDRVQDPEDPGQLTREHRPPAMEGPVGAEECSRRPLVDVRRAPVASRCPRIVFGHLVMNSRRAANRASAASPRRPHLTPATQPELSSRRAGTTPGPVHSPPPDRGRDLRARADRTYPHEEHHKMNAKHAGLLFSLLAAVTVPGCYNKNNNNYTTPTQPPAPGPQATVVTAT